MSKYTSEELKLLNEGNVLAEVLVEFITGNVKFHNGTCTATQMEALLAICENNQLLERLSLFQVTELHKAVQSACGRFTNPLLERPSQHVKYIEDGVKMIQILGILKSAKSREVKTTVVSNQKQSPTSEQKKKKQLGSEHTSEPMNKHHNDKKNEPYQNKRDLILFDGNIGIVRTQYLNNLLSPINIEVLYAIAKNATPEELIALLENVKA